MEAERFQAFTQFDLPLPYRSAAHNLPDMKRRTANLRNYKQVFAYKTEERGVTGEMLPLVASARLFLRSVISRIVGSLSITPVVSLFPRRAKTPTRNRPNPDYRRLLERTGPVRWESAAPLPP